MSVLLGYQIKVDGIIVSTAVKSMNTLVINSFPMSIFFDKQTNIS